jgi:glycosyltransferase involved in cell wall biosynthesis
MAAAPEIAAVIATHERETRLAFALEALAEQTLGPDRFEVVVVRSAVTRGPFAKAPDGLDARFIRHVGAPGAAAQRNAGWRAARAPLVAFLDDDSRPVAGWLEALLAAAGSDRTVVQGRIEPDPEERHLLFGLARSHEITAPSDRFETGNIAYPRALLEELGGFDESFPGGSWGEDTDLGRRALAAGASPAYSDEAVVYHAVVPRTLRQAIAEASRYGWLATVAARYPEFRRSEYPHRLVKPAHATLALALAGVAAATRRPAALALAAPYLAGHLRTHFETNPRTPRSLARFSLHLPQRALVECAELVAVLRAAVRERTLLL